MRKFLKLFLLSFIMILLSGCSIVYINKLSIDEIINMLGENSNLKSVSFEGFSYYLPQGVNLKENIKTNSILYYKGYKMYLYVDLVSYYHKVENTYEPIKGTYISKKITVGDKTGYLEVNEINNKYFIEYMYNYSKIEGYVEKEDLNRMLTVMTYILRSVKFKDSILETLVGDDSLNYSTEVFNIYKTNGNDSSSYLDIVDKYDKGRKDVKDEDVLELNDDVE